MTAINTPHFHIGGEEFFKCFVLHELQCVYLTGLFTSAAIVRTPNFLMVEIIHNDGAPLWDTPIRHFVIHKRTVEFLRHFLRFLFQRHKIAAIKSSSSIVSYTSICCLTPSLDNRHTVSTWHVRTERMSLPSRCVEHIHCYFAVLTIGENISIYNQNTFFNSVRLLTV